MNGTFFAFGFLMKGGFLTATVSDLPNSPKKSFLSAKIFFGFYYSRILAFTIRPFWLLLYKKVYRLVIVFFLYYERVLAFSIHILTLFTSWLGHSIIILKGFGFERRISHRHGLGFT